MKRYVLSWRISVRNIRIFLFRLCLLVFLSLTKKNITFCTIYRYFFEDKYFHFVLNYTCIKLLSHNLKKDTLKQYFCVNLPYFAAVFSKCVTWTVLNVCKLIAVCGFLFGNMVTNSGL